MLVCEVTGLAETLAIRSEKLRLRIKLKEIRMTKTALNKDDLEDLDKRMHPSEW